MDYFKFGEGDKAMVILPGLSVQSVMGSADAIAEAFSLFTKDFTLYVIDRRKELPAMYNVHDMAEDTAAALSAMGLNDIYIYAVSMGGMMAMTMAIEHPGLVRKMLLGSTSAHVTQEHFKNFEKWIDMARRGDREGLYLSFGEMIYPPAVFEQYRDYFTGASKTVTDEELKRFIVFASGVKNFNITDRLDEIQCPVLTMGTFEDLVLDSDATMEIAEKLDYKKCFRLYMYTGFGHAAYDTAPDYRQRVYDFFMEGDNGDGSL